MNAIQPAKTKDVRDFALQMGWDALKKAPVRAWTPPVVPNTRPQTQTQTQVDDGRGPIKCIRWDALPPVTDNEDVVEGLLTAGGSSMIFGKSNVGKSFFALDLAAAVASGTPYRGTMAVESGAVIYVTLEGQRSFNYRLAAMQLAGRLKPGVPLYVVTVPVNLLDRKDVENLTWAVQRTALKVPVYPRLVVIDTLSRAMPGGDECSAVDMTSAIRAVDEIRSSTGAHVMLIHHCGKDEARGARGHSSLRAAIDTEIEIVRPPGSDVIVANVTKQRDLETISPMAFSLITRKVGTTKKCKEIWSCAVKHENDIPAQCGARKNSWKKKPTLSPDAVMQLAPPAGESFVKKIFAKNMRETLGASVRDADAALAGLISQGKLIEKALPGPSGQKQLHISRPAAG